MGEISRMTDYKVNFERLQRTVGKLCPCLVASKETAVQENICVCKEFIDTGVCRCLLFTKIEDDK